MKNILLGLFSLCSIALYAQSIGAISGEVIDKNTQTAVPYASVVIKSNNEITTGGSTDNKGMFEISKIPLGTYRVEIQFIGFKTFIKEISITNENKTINLGRILMEENMLSLSNIEINGERTTIEQKIDRKIINVGKDLLTTGASASDIIGNIPSVSVNQDGEVTLRGNENVRVLIDGKPSNINTTDLLQQIPSTSINTIELITNPSAKYNPEGMSGIINITLKKNTNLGFNGSINSGITVGQKTRFNNSLNLNNRTGKFNIYGSYGNRLGKQITDGTVTRTEENTNQLTKNSNGRNSHLFKLGLDFLIDKKNTISVYTNQNIFESDSDGNKTISFFHNPVLDFVQEDNIIKDNMNATYNFGYKHNFNKEKHALELEFNSNSLESDIENKFYFSGNSDLNDYFEFIDDKRKNNIVNLDYSNPILKNSMFEIGLETRFEYTENDYVTNNTSLNNSNFSYDRNIYSFYTTWSQNFDKWSYNMGFRLEDYYVETFFKEVNSSANKFKDRLFNIYPSGFLKYTPDKEKKNSLILNFSRRIDRPSINQANPIRRVSTPQIVVLGNPKLAPQFTNSIEFNYNYKLKKGNISSGVFYRRIKAEINRIGYFDDVDPALLILDYANFDSNDAYGFEFSSSYSPTNWWNFTGSFDIYSRTQKGIIETENVTVSNTLLNLKVNNSFKATNNLTFQTFITYTGPQKILQYELKENIYVNTGVRYRFAKGKGNVSINFNDVFNSRRFAFEAYRTIKQVGEFRRDTQTIQLGLSYKFGSSKNNNLKRKKRDNYEKRDKFL